MGVKRGETFGFLGPNGAGKTTALKLLLGLARPTSGTASVLGRPIEERRAREAIGYLPELFRYQGWLTGREVLRLHCELGGIPRRVRASEAHRVLRLVDLELAADRRVGTYSKGMQQRLGMAAALLGEPELLFLDEPTSALDPVGRAEVHDLIRSLRSRGTTIFLNSHMLTEVEQVCDRVAVLDAGRVIAEGSLYDLLSGEVVRVRLGDPGVASHAALARFGQPRLQDGWLLFEQLPRAQVPELVASLVAAGAAVEAVETRRQDLEDRFRELLDRR